MKLSIVIPTYNSSAWIAATINRVTEIMQGWQFDFEVIIVNDGSADNTQDVLTKIAASNSFIKALTNSKNLGQQRSTFTGIKQCTGDYIVTIDDDLEYDPADIAGLYDFMVKNNFDLVYGVPNIAKSDGFKGALHALYIWSLKNKNKERKTSFRIIKAQVADQLTYPKNSGPFVLDMLLEKLTGNIGYLNVKYYPNNTSRYSVFMYLRHYLEIQYLRLSE